MQPAAYYTQGYMGWTPYALYPLHDQWAGQLQPPPPPRHPILIPLPDVTPYLPPRDLGDAVVGHRHRQPSRPPASPQRPRTPSRPRAGPLRFNEPIVRAALPQSCSSSPDIWTPYPHRPHHRLPPDPTFRPIGPGAYTHPTNPSPYTRPTNPGAYTPSRPAAVDPILALPEPPFGTLGLEWDLADDPIRNIHDRPEHRSIHMRDLIRPAAVVCSSNPRGGSRPLERLVLIFAGLPMEIEVAQGTRPATLGRWVDEDEDEDGDVPWVTVYDVFGAIWMWLVAPIGEDEMTTMNEELVSRVIQTGEGRRMWRPARPWSGDGAPFLNIDFLGERRRFKGIRPALRDEVPVGRRLGEVFIIELGESV